jgi:hypothetical protein
VAEGVTSWHNRARETQISRPEVLDVLDWVFAMQDSGAWQLWIDKPPPDWQLDSTSLRSKLLAMLIDFFENNAWAR